jgi:hypothetical protein
MKASPASHEIAMSKLSLGQFTCPKRLMNCTTLQTFSHSFVHPHIQFSL